MGKLETNFDWIGNTHFEGRPSHLEILDRLEAAIRSGELQSGDRLPAQRQLAAKLSVDLTTVTRAYAAARARGLVEGTVGRGTFVREQLTDTSALLADLVANDPPKLSEISVSAILAETAAAIAKDADVHALMSIRRYFARPTVNTQAAAWLRPFIGQVPGERILATPGAQASLAATLTVLCPPGATIIVDQLSHPGLLWLAAKFGWRLAPCAGDAEGMLPDALERLCATETPSALYVIPTHHNPTAATMSLERRQAIADVATRADLLIVEADPYSPFVQKPLPAIAALAPERTFYYSTLSKIFGAGFRLAYLVPPESWSAPIGESLRALSLGPTPLLGAIFSRWLEDGVAQKLIAATRAEVRARRAMAATLLPQAVGGPESAHVWIPLPSSRVSERMLLAARERGVAVATEEAFVVSHSSPSGLRLTLGNVPDRAKLDQALRIVAEIHEQSAPSPVPLPLL